MISALNLPARLARRARQSMLFTWSARMTPETFARCGRATSNGYPFAWLVMGQTSARPTFAL